MRTQHIQEEDNRRLIGAGIVAGFLLAVYGFIIGGVLVVIFN